MIYLTIEEIQLLHQKLLKATGGFSGIRDLGLLESAVYGAMQSFGDKEALPRARTKGFTPGFCNYTEPSLY